MLTKTADLEKAHKTLQHLYSNANACACVFIILADTVDSITPDKVRGLRDMLNSSAMDIMYYSSPLYRDEVRLSIYIIHRHSTCTVVLHVLSTSDTR